MANLNETFARILGSSDGRLVLLVLLSGGRLFGVMAVMPLFTWTGVTGILRVALAIGLALPIAAGSQVGATMDGVTAAVALGLLAKEIAVGAALGLVFGIPIWAAQGAGDILDSYRGASAENIFDTVNAVEVSVFGTLNGVLAMAWFVASGAFRDLFAAVEQSFAIWSPISFGMQAGAQDLMSAASTILARLAIASFLFSAPLLTLMIVTELVLGLISRSARQVNLNDLSPLLKTTTCILSLPIYSAFIFFLSEESYKATTRAITTQLGLAP